MSEIPKINDDTGEVGASAPTGDMPTENYWDMSPKTDQPHEFPPDPGDPEPPEEPKPLPPLEFPQTEQLSANEKLENP